MNATNPTIQSLVKRFNGLAITGLRLNADDKNFMNHLSEMLTQELETIPFIKRFQDKPIHNIKCWTDYWQDVALGLKPFELRKNDRDYRKGDFLVIEEFDKQKERFTGRHVEKIITYVLKDFPGIKSGWCILGIADPSHLDYLSRTNEEYQKSKEIFRNSKQ